MPTIRETIQKVNEFAELSEGWHFGEGSVPAREEIDQAIEFLDHAAVIDIERANAFPGISGQVEVTFYSGDRMLEITVEPNGSLTIAEDHGREQVSFEENLSMSDAYQRLEEFNQNLWASSDPFMLNITTQSVSVGSLAAHWISGAENPFRSWIQSVQSKLAVQYALTLKGTTTTKQVIQGSTGEYVTLTFPTLVESFRKQPRREMTVTGTSTIGAGTLPGRLLSD